jgi:UMF1 family MFS transporter
MRRGLVVLSFYLTFEATEAHRILGSFLPVTLEQLGRENAVLRSDGITPCIQPHLQSNSRAPFKRDEGQTCVLHILGNEVNTSSFALYSFSLAVFFQTLVLISIGAIADYGKCFSMPFSFP